MATTTRATRPNRFEVSTVALFTVLAILGHSASPVMAASRIGLGLPGGTILTQPPILTQPDPCLPQPQLLGFTASSSRVTLGDSVTLTWNAQIPSGCPYVLSVLDQTMTLIQQVGPQGSLTTPTLQTGDFWLTLSWTADLGRRAYLTAPVAVDLPVDPQSCLQPTAAVPLQRAFSMSGNFQVFSNNGLSGP
jgi:hypothetical protein